MKPFLGKVFLIFLLTLFGAGHAFAQKPQGMPRRPNPERPTQPARPTAPANITINGHEAVDLGLPSGLKWATCNVGAYSPEGYGDYFAWGETSTKSSYTSSNSKTYNKNIGDISGNPKYDAARANWGSSWRLPTKAECQELINNCTSVWTTKNGVVGRKFTSKRNGNSIFLPAAGWRRSVSRSSAGGHGGYWSSTPYGHTRAYCLYLYSGNSSVSYYDRDIGRSVRPVSD